VVSGGGSGIGRAICLRFVEAGATVHILGRDAVRLAETQAAAAAPERVMPHTVDLSSVPEIERFAATLRQRDIPVDILVNNAGIYRITPLESLSEVEYDLLMGINLKAAIWLTKELLPLMDAAGGGSIINILSTLGYQPVAGCSLYSVSKAGLLMFTRSVALECAERGIRCNAISPGVVRTSIFETVMPPERIAGHLERMAAAHPLGRVGDPGDVAAAALYLASDEARWVTGVNLPVDGGISLT
jgi:NAD(P)-dependent dehydrogenase (short-subunit alcohol dehydrogenase family)